jgi:multifunctional 2-oxoglutarate metabolism enzyme
MVERAPQPALGAFGPNAWLVDDMYERYRADPSSVGESWREFFEDYRRDVEAPTNGAASVVSRAATRPPPTEEAEREAAPTGETAPPIEEAPRAAAPTTPVAPGGTPSVLRGAGARVVANMQESLAVPTATSVRSVPARLLEVNRTIVNNHLARSRGGKVSFTHVIGYAVVQALKDVSAMTSVFTEVGGKPAVVVPPHVGLGVAVDVERQDGSRTLLVPCISEADTLDFREFLLAYEDLIRKVRRGTIGADDFVGVTVTLTNPGTVGTEHSVPRLMPGQSVIVGVGSLGYPAEFEASDPSALARLGVGKTLTLTSTYDHRVIQGAESGRFLGRVHDLLLGADGFYDSVFRSMRVPYEPARWERDHNPQDQDGGEVEKATRVQTLVNMYRVRGHLIADLDPLDLDVPHLHPELDPLTYGLTVWDLDREFLTDEPGGTTRRTLGDIFHRLRDAYSRTVGVEYMHIQEPDQKHWIQEHVEGVSTEMGREDQRHILGRLNAAEAFERFLHSKYIGQKRFGLEGAESAIPLLDAVLEAAADDEMAEVVIGMAHRGRLNVLANIVGLSYGEIFREFEGDLDPDSVQGSGDVKYHRGAEGTYRSRSGRTLPVSVASNPAHLESVDPVVEGMARAKQDVLDEGASYRVLALLVHGDAGFAGQGVVAETLNLSGLRGYRTGGTVHVVINNQLGFTTSPEAARTSVYPTDVAKMVQAPIFHVNGDDPEACVRVARLAFAFRQAFRKDVVIDMICYRRYGHNEADEPSYTQPTMYERIERTRSVRKIYTESLVNRGDLTLEDAEEALNDFSGRLQKALDETRAAAAPERVLPALRPQAESWPALPTGVERPVLDRIREVLFTPPEGFTVHPKLVHQFDARSALYDAGQVDWSMAEAFAFGSIMLDGSDVRLSGQDSRRGTFSQRHSVLVDVESGRELFPLSRLSGPKADGSRATGRLFAYDSLLSEYAALGFEYGYSVARDDCLAIWEAQFGDFANAAQVVIDQYIVAAEDKWGQSSGLVLLLPHGSEGQGPEHSSARLERFLALAAEGNITVAQPTTAAQYFHLLRAHRQRRPLRPLVLLSPKSLLRARPARSSLDDLVRGAFQVVLDDPATNNEHDQDESAGLHRGRVDKIVLCSGKIAFEAMARRDTSGAPVAVVRVEELYPWPAGALAEVLARYENASTVLWLQEEPENMGAWSFVHARLHRLLRERFTLVHVSRAESGSPATGSAALHQLEADDLLKRAIG